MAEREPCAWCRRPFVDAGDATVGRPRIYCRRSCRQRAYEARRRASELSWGDDEIGRLRRRLDELYVATASLTDIVDELVDESLDDTVRRRLEEAVGAVGALVGVDRR